MVPVIIIVVCAIFTLVFQPFVDRVIGKNVHSKWPAIILRIVIYWVIFMALYGVAAMLGFKISD